jgi:probable HAF family extracellular repeat protein
MACDRIVKLILIGVIVFGGFECASADVQYLFTTIAEAPGAFDTVPEGINIVGQIVGFFSTGPISPSPSSGFLYSGGSFTVLDIPGAYTVSPQGINDSGQISGWSLYDGAYHGFLYSGGSFTTIDAPGGFGTFAEGINNSGQIVGSSVGATQANGFLYSGGSFSTIDVPGAPDTYAYGINNNGQIVGKFYPEGFSGPILSFLYSGGNFTTIDVPGTPASINDSGQIVGTFSDSDGSEHGYLYSAGSVTQIDFPGASDTELGGINNAGQIVGDFTNASGYIQGFLATPMVVPEPRTFAVLAACLLGMFGLAHRRRLVEGRKESPEAQAERRLRNSAPDGHGA